MVETAQQVSDRMTASHYRSVLSVANPKVIAVNHVAITGQLADAASTGIYRLSAE